MRSVISELSELDEFFNLTMPYTLEKSELRDKNYGKEKEKLCYIVVVAQKKVLCT